MAELEYWVWFSAVRPLRFASRRALLERYGDASEIFRAGRRDLAALGLRGEELEALCDKDMDAAHTILRRCEEEDVHLMSIRDAAYPERLKEIPDPPTLLYYKGHFPSVDLEPLITVVGTRRCTPYGEAQARKLAHQLAAGGAVVVTGLAAGIDSRAAEGALMAGGKVVGVLGVAINQVYPRYNKDLYEDVCATGVLMSEYPPDAGGSAAWFPQRNRIMAALSVATLVVEAPERSGALITAHRAADYGRDVFAVPGNADAYASRGCIALLKEGASVAVSGWDVLSAYEDRFPGKISREGKRKPPEPPADPVPPSEELPAPTAGATENKLEIAGLHRGFFKFREKTKRRELQESGRLAEQLSDLSETQLRIVGVMTKEAMHVDDIVDLSGLPAATVLSELTMLQIKGYVIQSAGKRFTLNIIKK